MNTSDLHVTYLVNVMKYGDVLHFTVHTGKLNRVRTSRVKCLCTFEEMGFFKLGKEVFTRLNVQPLIVESTAICLSLRGG